MEDLCKVIIYRMEDVNYIGSTKTTLKQRASSHRADCFNPNYKEYNYPIYKHIRNNMLGIRVIPIKELFVGKTACRMVEQYYIDKYDSINNGLNTYRSYTTSLELREQQRKSEKKSYQKHKEKRSKKVKCERCGSVVNYSNLPKHHRTKKCKRLSQLPK